MPTPNRFVSLLLATIVAVLAFGAGVWLSSTQPNVANIDGLLWPNPPPLAAFNFVDHDSRPFTLEQLQGRWSLVFFGFTHCPDVCPTTLAALASAAQELQSDPRYAAAGQVVFVSVDPERDSPDKLRDYVKYFSPDFIGVTSASEELRSFATSIGALFMKIDQAGTDYTMDHSAGIFFISPDTHVVSVLTPPHNAAAIVARFRAVSRFVDAQS